MHIFRMSFREILRIIDSVPLIPGEFSITGTYSTYSGKISDMQIQHTSLILFPIFDTIISMISDSGRKKNKMKAICV